MPMKFPKIFENFWRQARLPETGNESINEKKHFGAATILEKAPTNAEVNEQDFIIVVYQGIDRWALFKCPCGCGDVISLPLAAPHKPRWSVYVDEKGFASLYPSVWRNTGCMSHFIVRSGIVFWAGRTGVSPFIASPKHYKPRLPE